MGGPYEWMSYQRLGEYVRHLSNGLAGLGLGEGARAGVYGPNCPEWMIAMQATNRMGMQCVPLYDTMGANAVEFILNHSEASVALASADKLPKLAEALPKCEGVKTVVYWGDVAGGDRERQPLCSSQRGPGTRGPGTRGGCCRRIEERSANPWHVPAEAGKAGR